MSDHLDLKSLRRRKARWKRPRRILGLWARLGLLVAVILVSVFFAIGLVSKAVRPYREASLQSSQLAETRRQSDLLEAQNADLQRQITYLKTTGGIESSARRLGYLHPGEYPIVVEGLGHPGPSTDPSTAPVTVPTAPVPHSQNPARRLWQHLTGR